MRYPRQTALDAYIEKKAEFDHLLSKLQEVSSEHFDIQPDKINWGHVGDITKYTYILRQITDVVFKQSEHTPD